MSKEGLSPLTQAQAQQSMEDWNRLFQLLEKSFKILKNWVKVTVNAAGQNLAYIVKQDQSDLNNLWEVIEQVNLVTAHYDSYDKKLSYIEGLINRMNDKIMSTPKATSANEKDIIEDRQDDFQLHKLVFTWWDANTNILKSFIKNDIATEMAL